ncbi:SRPBCC family protein [Kocuria turfanensis]|uniref:Polyketide cyclase n=1 Tax=Kocuria turfanensis TaxID=388357 RepID=A0A512ID57_9MICC|nr:SRPBCC family protein [Kocuria turfanensis]GEO95630.1 hypothetical protein KTU01_17530 [Kocuria turfanensis]
MALGPASFCVDAKTVIGVDPCVVERLLLDSGCFPLWHRGVAGVPTISTPVLQTGTSVEFFGRVGPLRFPYVTIVSAQEPGRKLALRTTRGIVDLLAVTTWAAVDGGTEVRTTVDGRLTAARAGLATWAERIVRRNLGAELGDLKRLLETGRFEFTVPSQLTAHPPRCPLETPPDFF